MIAIRNIAALIGIAGVSLVNYFLYFYEGWEGVISLFIMLALVGVYGGVMEHHFKKPCKLEKYFVSYVWISIGAYLLYVVLFFVIPFVLERIVESSQL